MVVLSFPQLEVIEVQAVEGEVTWPYVPGYLSFRELPLVLRACERVRKTPEIVLVDGQGIAHPLRLGLACIWVCCWEANRWLCEVAALWNVRHAWNGARCNRRHNDRGELVGADRAHSQQREACLRIYRAMWVLQMQLNRCYIAPVDSGCLNPPGWRISLRPAGCAEGGCVCRFISMTSIGE
jgi:hypothetical protein